MTNEEKPKKMAAYYCVFVLHIVHVSALPLVCFQFDVSYKKTFLFLAAKG